MKTNDEDSVQNKIMEALTLKLGSKCKLVELLKCELNIENSAAYNRISGKVALSLNEIKPLLLNHSISVDEYILPFFERITFVSDAMRKLPNSYDQYLSNVINALKGVKKQREITVTTIGNEIPLFHFANFPLLYHFKLYYWSQTYWEFGNAKQPFDTESNQLDVALRTKTTELGGLYNKMPSKEVWTTDIVSNILNQIIHILNLDNFKAPSMALQLIDEVRKMCIYLQECCTTGIKKSKNNLAGQESPIEVYYSEFHDGTDAILFGAGDSTISFIKYDGPNFIRTYHQEFGGHSNRWIDKIIRRSALISASAEKDRRSFFREVNKKIDVAEKRVNYVMEGL